jgi:ketosteroid isomerase-like protein
MKASILMANVISKLCVTAKRPTIGGKLSFQRLLPRFLALAFTSGLLVAATVKHTVIASTADDAKAVAMLDTQYQSAVQKNDAAGMARILSDDFVLVTGSGKAYSKADLLEEARGGRTLYERQDDSEQKVRIWGDTAVVTAKLWAKGTENGKPFEYTLWFSDTYVRTSAGWRYVFGQASLPLPKTS